MLPPANCINRYVRLLLWLLPAAGVFAQTSREYDIKAAFVYNFASFVDWPPQAFHDDDAPFVIGVLGADPFGAVLQQLVAGEQAKGRPLVVRRLARLPEVTGCHILFISRSEAGRVPEILRHCLGHAVLTVSDVPGFVETGGMIGFSTEGNRILLHVNASAAETAELVISSKLLRVARVVQTEGGGVR